MSDVHVHIHLVAAARPTDIARAVPYPIRPRYAILGRCRTPIMPHRMLPRPADRRRPHNQSPVHRHIRIPRGRAITHPCTHLRAPILPAVNMNPIWPGRRRQRRRRDGRRPGWRGCDRRRPRGRNRWRERERDRHCLSGRGRRLQ